MRRTHPSIRHHASALLRIALPVSVLVLIAAGCGNSGPVRALGEDDVITVVADSAEYDAVADVLENAFQRPFFTPQPESWFRLERVDFSGIETAQKRKNVLIVAPLDAPHVVGEYIRSVLDSSVESLVRDGKEQVFLKKDLWAGDQTVLFLTGATREDLQRFALDNARRLEHFFKNAWDARERRRILSLGREEEVERHLREDYGFSLAVIKGWFVGKDSADLRSVLLRRQDPAETERWVLVHWIDNADPRMLTQRTALDLRNRLTAVLYRTYDDQAWVRVDTVNHLQFDEVDFNGRFAIRMSGLWQMSDWSMGGPFIAYLFYDEKQRRIYLIDGSVFAPKYEKKKLIQDVDVMLGTFVPGSSAYSPPPS